MSEIEKILEDRGKTYGEFMGHAKVSQRLQDVVFSELLEREVAYGSKNLQPDQREALVMICHKMARIVNGDPHYADSWLDISGYAKLVADRIEAQRNSARPIPTRNP